MAPIRTKPIAWIAPCVCPDQSPRAIARKTACIQGFIHVRVARIGKLLCSVVFLHTEQTMEEESVLSIQEAFGDLKDPRSRTPTHNLQEMLVVALCAILCGAETWVGIQIWAQGKLEWLRRFVPLCNGVP